MHQPFRGSAWLLKRIISLKWLVESMSNPRKKPRIHAMKGHKDPFESIMDGKQEASDEANPEEDAYEHEDIENEGVVEDLEETGTPPQKKRTPIKEEEISTVSEHDDENEDDAQPMEDEDLMFEHGTQEEGIHSGEDGLSMRPDIEPVEGTPAREQAGISRDDIKEKILLKSRGHSLEDASTVLRLELLEDDKKKALFIGRKRSVQQKSGMDGALYVGRVQDDERFRGHKLFVDSLNPHVIFTCGSRGSGKCLTGDTLITLQDGRVIPIQELENISEKVLGLNHNLKIQSLSHEEFYKRTVEKIVKIRLRSGREIKLTPEHPLLTVQGWKPAQELSENDRIATPRTLPVVGTKTVRECEVKLMAYLLAEGHLSNHFVLFSNEDLVIQNDFFDCIKEFHPNLKILKHGKPSDFRISQQKKQIDYSTVVRNDKGQFTNKGFIRALKSPIMEWLISLGIYGKLSVEKFIPSFIFELPKEQLIYFMSRMFSCDGSIYRVNRGKNWCISYSSSSERMIRQVQHLMLRFGVLSTLRSKTVTTNGKEFLTFELTVYGENVLTFIAQIGFFGTKAEIAKTAADEMLGLVRNPNTDTIPREIWDQFKVNNWAATGRALGYSSPKSLSHSVTYSPSREKLLRIAQVQENRGIQLLAQSDIFWDEIIDVIEINESTEVYDISVPIHHNFVANDIIVHNSYLLGVLAEELSLHNTNVGTVVVDPVGVFWSMKYPNKEEKEVKDLPHYDLMPQGLENMRVFIPEGMKSETPRSTYDALFSIPPSLLTSEDWCLTFKIERFSPTGLLLEKALKKLEKGYKTTSGELMKGRKDTYTLNELISCLENDSELNSKEKGYKTDSVRALVSRFEAAKGWGIFSDRGTPLSEISKAGQLTVIDTSFLDDTVTALVIGILARRLLAARKIQTRKEAANEPMEKSVESLMENEIPPTWLFIDEAHTLIPGGNVSTPATTAIVEYVKQGRRPGCSLVFATQQPSAIDTRVLSQLDIILSHKLIFDDDIKAVTKRTPTIIPMKYKHPHFLKTLPVGTALVGDRREETNRAFVLKIRPRMSQHEGRDAETGERKKSLSEKEARMLAVSLLMSKLDKEGMLDKETIEQVIQMLNQKYGQHMMLSSVLDEMEARGAKIDPKTEAVKSPNFVELIPKKKEKGLGTTLDEDAEQVAMQKVENLVKLVEMPSENEDTDLSAFPVPFSREEIVERFLRVSKKGLFGVGKPVEQLRGQIELSYIPVWKVQYRQFTGKTSYVVRECFIDAEKGEFLHFLKNQFATSSGLQAMAGLSTSDQHVIRMIRMSGQTIANLQKKTGLDEKTVKRSLVKLRDRGMVNVLNENTLPTFTLAKDIDIPFTGNEKELSSLQALKLVHVSNIAKSIPKYSEDQLHTLLTSLWPNILVNNVKEIYRPVFEATFVNTKTSEHRVVRLDGYTGMILSE